MMNDRLENLKQTLVEANGFGEAVFAIEPGGLRRLGAGKLQLRPGTECFMGASSSPDHIVVVKADDKWIEYTSYLLGYKKTRRIQRSIGEDLISQGCQNWLKTARYNKVLISKVKDLLAGKKVKPVKVEDFQPVIIVAEPTTKKDFGEGGPPMSLWRRAEQYGNVGWLRTGQFEIQGQRNVVKSIKKDKEFRVVSVTDAPSLY